jgi:tetratricopeptide (TPR) repeat protein
MENRRKRPLGETAWSLQQTAVEGLPARTALAESGPMLDASLALAGRMADRLEWVAERAFTLSHFSIAERGYEQLGVVADVDQALAVAHCRFLRGDSAGALERLDGVDPALLGDAAGELLLLRALYRLGGTRGAALAVVDGDLAAAAPLVASDPARGLLAAVRGAVSLVRGAPAAAVAELRAAVETWSFGHPYVLNAYGDALTAVGDSAVAHDAWSRAHDLAHPESFHAAEARRRLATPYR